MTRIERGSVLELKKALKKASNRVSNKASKYAQPRRYAKTSSTSPYYATSHSAPKAKNAFLRVRISISCRLGFESSRRRKRAFWSSEYTLTLQSKTLKILNSPF